MTGRMCQNVNFENGGTTIQMGIMNVLLNILSISLLSRVYGMSCYRVVMSFYVVKKLIKCKWSVRTFG